MLRENRARVRISPKPPAHRQVQDNPHRLIRNRRIRLGHAIDRPRVLVEVKPQLAGSHSTEYT
jgi:hypothetical protein